MRHIHIKFLLTVPEVYHPIQTMLQSLFRNIPPIRLVGSSYSRRIRMAPDQLATGEVSIHCMRCGNYGYWYADHN